MGLDRSNFQLQRKNIMVKILTDLSISATVLLGNRDVGKCYSLGRSNEIIGKVPL